MSQKPFSEGPKPPKVYLLTSNSIDTTTIDPFRQGVELTEDKFYYRGIVKIHAGYEEHQLPQAQFGEQSQEIQPEKRFVDIDYFNPLLYIVGKSGTKKSGLTYPIVFQHSLLNPGNVLDGTIEPLAIRHVAMFSSIDAPFEAHAFKGNLESGNFNGYIHSDRVVNIQKVKDVSRGISLYEDNVDNFNDSPINLGYFPNTSKTVSPFEDDQIKSGITLSNSMSGDIRSTLTQMSPASDNYVPSNYIRNVVGFDWENTTSTNSDSVVFGNMLYKRGTTSKQIIETIEKFDPNVYTFDPTLLPWTTRCRDSIVFADVTYPRTVSRWTDLSGLKFDYRLIRGAGAPTEGTTLNDYPTIAFTNATSTVLYSSVPIYRTMKSDFFDLYLVLKVDQITTSNSDPALNSRIWGDAGTMGYQMVGLSATSSGNRLQFWYVDSSSTTRTVELAITLGTWMLIEAKLENGRLTLCRNRESEVVTNTTLQMIDTATYLQVGDVNRSFVGEIAEYGLTFTKFDADERDGYKKYVSLRYSLP